MSNNVKNCRDCDAKVQWAETDRGKNILVDVEPVADGDLALTHLDPYGGEMKVRHIRKHDPIDESIPRYTCHFGTCPQREQRQAAK